MEMTEILAGMTRYKELSKDETLNIKDRAELKAKLEAEDLLVVVSKGKELKYDEQGIITEEGNPDAKNMFGIYKSSDGECCMCVTDDETGKPGFKRSFTEETDALTYVVKQMATLKMLAYSEMMFGGD